MLHDNDLGAIVTNDVLCVNETPGKSSSNEREDEETDVGSIRDIYASLGLDALAEGNLMYN